ncbi:hypothetical protein CORT_0G01580 [Candida orthopsilosis Co 90-125]|uniref:Uncharacterized protein n=1 Tax=Candida orthopsilosis (strain 90-125) TaxID=1136231 RepID=H8XAJ5_CANO9|nr:hypothetical protein CORT_0G01580 [Candida orthopsilosis Co 90-125]CCG24845.1 hypothetical protein CORT_0G01580 [Candida orthopsilosis Co 90-125]
MSHDYPQILLKLQLEEDAYFNQLSYGHIINPPTTNSDVKANYESQKDEDEETNISSVQEQEQKQISRKTHKEVSAEKDSQIFIGQNWFTLHFNQLNELRVNINQQQIRAYNDSVKRYRKCERHWIRLYREKKKQEGEKKERQLQKRARRLEKKQQIKQRVRYVTKKLSGKLNYKKVKIKLLNNSVAHKNIEEANKSNSVRSIFTSVRIERLFQKSTNESNVIKKEDARSKSKSVNGHRNEQDIWGHKRPKLKGIAKIQSFQCLSHENDKLRPIYCIFTIKNTSTSSQDQPPQQYQSQGSILVQLLQRSLQVNYLRWVDIKLVKYKIQLQVKVRLLYHAAHLVIFKYRIYRIKLIRKFPSLLSWTNRKKIQITRLRIRLKKSIITNLNQNKEFTFNANIDAEYDNVLPQDNFMHIHQAFLQFEMYKLHLLCQYRPQFTYLSI